MKKIVPLLTFLIVWLASFNSGAQHTTTKTDSLLTGTWRGSSLCQLKNSPCHDESVVYHISRVPGTDTFYIQANKIVQGPEEEMGILPCVFNEKSNQLVSTAFKGIWTFLLKKMN